MKSPDTLLEELLALAMRVVNSFTMHGCMLGLSESVTGGTIASFLARVDGCSKILFASQVLYSIPGKSSFLDVPIEEIETNGTVSEFIIEKMNESMARRFFTALPRMTGERPRSFIALAICGVAGSAIENLPRGTVIIGMDTYSIPDETTGGIVPTRHEVEWFEFDRDRATIILHATRQALFWLEAVSFLSRETNN
jgi:nicotinamide mononucleotide (NMN) deamidase PncC